MVRLPGCWIQLVVIALVPILEQIFPSVHPLKTVSVDEVVGFMMNRPLASQEDWAYGQQLPVREQESLQSCIAPNLPISSTPLVTNQEK